MQSKYNDVCTALLGYVADDMAQRRTESAWLYGILADEVAGDDPSTLRRAISIALEECSLVSCDIDDHADCRHGLVDLGYGLDQTWYFWLHTGATSELWALEDVADKRPEYMEPVRSLVREARLAGKPVELWSLPDWATETE